MNKEEIESRLKAQTEINMELLENVYEWKLQYKELQQELNQKNKIIEEIKEYCKSYRCWEDEDGTWHESDFYIDDLLEIIEKGSEK